MEAPTQASRVRRAALSSARDSHKSDQRYEQDAGERPPGVEFAPAPRTLSGEAPGHLNGSTIAHGSSLAKRLALPQINSGGCVRLPHLVSG
jgi:hypothetical protein